MQDKTSIRDSKKPWPLFPYCLTKLAHVQSQLRVSMWGLDVFSAKRSNPPRADSWLWFLLLLPVTWSMLGPRSSGGHAWCQRVLGVTSTSSGFASLIKAALFNRWLWCWTDAHVIFYCSELVLGKHPRSRTLCLAPAYTASGVLMDSTFLPR